MEQAVRNLRDSITKLKRAVFISVAIALFGVGLVIGFAIGLFVGGF